MAGYSYTTGYSTTADTIWADWTTTSATTISNTSNIVWDSWNTAGTYAFAGHTPPVLTEEQLAAQEAAKIVRAEQAEIQRLERNAAAQKARELLLDNLDDQQVEEFADNGYFHVTTRDGERRYRLRPGGQPLRVAGEDGRQFAYCIHPAYGYPADDVVLAQKFLLESDEDAFLRIANARPTTVPVPVAA